MAKFLTTAAVSYHLEKIINEAEDQLAIISPYIKANSRIREYITRKCWEPVLKANVDHPIATILIYRGKKRDPELEEWFRSLPYAVAGFNKDLHAKCYLNEKEALITSMNLYDYSQINNYEMGILISSDSEPELYNQIYEEVINIRRAMTEVHFDDGEIEDDWKEEHLFTSSDDETKIVLPESGFCLRCRTEIPLVLDRPYCNSHHRTWARFKNENWEEDYCHTCGVEHDTSMAKPLCLSCFRKYRGAFRATS